MVEGPGCTKNGERARKLVGHIVTGVGKTPACSAKGKKACALKSQPALATTHQDDPLSGHVDPPQGAGWDTAAVRGRVLSEVLSLGKELFLFFTVGPQSSSGGATPVGIVAPASSGGAAAAAPVEIAGIAAPATQLARRDWACSECTFLHTGSRCGFLACAVCGAERCTRTSAGAGGAEPPSSKRPRIERTPNAAPNPPAPDLSNDETCVRIHFGMAGSLKVVNGPTFQKLQRQADAKHTCGRAGGRAGGSLSLSLSLSLSPFLSPSLPLPLPLPLLSHAHPPRTTATPLR